MRIFTIATSVLAAIKSAWTRGSPFAAATALFPTNDEGKYVIGAEGIRLAFTNHGGALTNLWINDTHGQEIDIVMGFDQADYYPRYEGNPFLNGAIGRYAGIISNARFELGGVNHQVSANAHTSKGTVPMTWNGGEHSWGRTTLDIGSHTENSITFVLFDRSWNGFPGTAASCLTHTVTPYEWRIAFGVTPTRKPSPINMSQQVFWNLDGLSGNYSSSSAQTILEHELHLPFSGLRIGTDDEGIPTGDLKANKKGSPYDFWSAPKTVGHYGIGKPGSRGYDDTFLISRFQPWKKEDHPVASLSSARSGIKVELYTDQEALHVHTWNNKPDQVPLKRKQGTGIVPEYGAISLEMQDWTDGINNPQWQRESKTVWGMDGLYTTFSTYKFSVDGAAR
ncbi:putative aldose 1-epimerase family protein [Aspergillus pseudonomiae]|uniref:Putative aldose 1-epimerase family protein n=1 Tax=Aspergillus pseudonomiae TaxID=1506151 RepID=A0A5N6HX29_9EURO|nr:putative aldose 1-epimerase family protein [Aspergillus pseudonomiae]KAB8258818.1 putative aldose 1-epimerase family protein [Aspergillus pseudonomiae]KAE8403349.1 putative aldose 1-epimerase family protein [Aspergillus pseudonomiae]